uniref:RGS domain-containing protein n=1 Tax=Gopherus agassizii TaxID=38772 RepID=A0A452IMD7_9SAUR
MARLCTPNRLDTLAGAGRSWLLLISKMLETDTEELRVMASEEEKVAGGDACPAAEGAAEGALKEAALGAPLEEEKVVIATNCVEEQPGSSPAFVIPELRLDSTADSLTDEEDEEEDEEEEDSDQHYLERSEGKRCSMIEPSSCEPTYTLTVQGSLRRRTHSEGSLLQETKGHCFTSDTTLNCLDIQSPQARWALPSPRTLKKQLTKNGGSIHQLGLLFSGHRKLSGTDNECSCEDGDEASCKKRSKNLAKDMKNRLGIFRRRNESPGANPVSKLDKAMKSLKPTPEEALRWGESLEKLLLHKYGLAAFRAFLRTEFSEENLEFWLACEEYKKIKSQSKMVSKAKKIFAEYIAIQSCKEVTGRVCCTRGGAVPSSVFCTAQTLLGALVQLTAVPGPHDASCQKGREHRGPCSRGDCMLGDGEAPVGARSGDTGQCPMAGMRP